MVRVHYYPEFEKNSQCFFSHAGVVKLVDTPGLGPGTFCHTGSSPVIRRKGDVVQLVERMLCTHKVIGSTPIVSKTVFTVPFSFHVFMFLCFVFFLLKLKRKKNMKKKSDSLKKSEKTRLESKTTEFYEFCTLSH